MKYPKIKCTPGSWIAVGAWVEHEDDNVADICSCNPRDLSQEHLGRSYEEQCANARLIAAAPELLETVIEMLFDENGNEWIDSNLPDSEWDDRVWNATERAKKIIARVSEMRT